MLVAPVNFFELSGKTRVRADRCSEAEDSTASMKRIRSNESHEGSACEKSTEDPKKMLDFRDFNAQSWREPGIGRTSAAQCALERASFPWPVGFFTGCSA